MAGGAQVVVGMDEVGKGAWAGPLTIGAAVLPESPRLNGIRDSKLLDETTRERLFPKISSWCGAWSVGHASHDECDELGHVGSASGLPRGAPSTRSASNPTASSSTGAGTSSGAATAVPS